MLSLSNDNQSEVIESFNSTSWYLHYLLNIDNTFFDSMANHIYPSEFQLNKLMSQIPRPHFLDLQFLRVFLPTLTFIYIGWFC